MDGEKAGVALAGCALLAWAAVAVVSVVAPVACMVLGAVWLWRHL